MDRNIYITIGGDTIIRTIIIALLFFALFLVRDLVLVVLTAVVIASAIEPFTKWLMRRLPRVLAVLLIYLFLTLFFIGIFYFFVPTLVDDAVHFFSSVPGYLDSISLWDPLKQIGPFESGEVPDSLSREIVEGQRAVEELRGGFSLERLLKNIGAFAGRSSEGFLQSVSAVFGGVLSLIFIVIFSFYFSVQEDGVAKFLRVVTPQRHERYVIDLWNRSQEKIGRWLQGQLLLALLVGILVYLGLSILNVRHALSLAFLAAVFEIIPLFGPILSAIPAVLAGYADGGLYLGLTVLGLFVIIQQFENHLIYPLVVRKIIGVPSILVVLALIVGGKLAGFLGILLSVPVAAALMEYVGDLQRRKSIPRI